MRQLVAYDAGEFLMDRILADQSDSSMSRRGGHQKWDAKKMTMKKLIYYDSDLASRFDDDDDDGK
ncbi:unnamed protein product, partial [Brugia timori]|uniref:Uncharacterized protein n=1 Tax=Brugia timori TaxID=42155 RepID=A0A0R3QEB4_9BILA